MLKVLILLAVAVVARSSVAAATEQDQIASHQLGFSGAQVSVRESYSRTRWPIAEQTFVLKGANGHIVSIALHNGGGSAGNNSINLFAAKQDQFFLISEKDCLQFDPIKVIANQCAQRPTCAVTASGSRSVVGMAYLGRFDLMNGFDPPHSTFRLRWRFGPFEDAVEGGSCPVESIK